MQIRVMIHVPQRSTCMCNQCTSSLHLLAKGGRYASTFQSWATGCSCSHLVACGSNNSMIRVSPAVADAKDYPGGVVSFTASGARNPTWCMGTINGICNGKIASPAVIDSTGHARCVQGQSATVTVLAGTGAKVGLP